MTGKFKLAIQKKGKALFAHIELKIELSGSHNIFGATEIILPSLPEPDPILIKLNGVDLNLERMKDFHKSIKEALTDAIDALNKTNENMRISMVLFDWNTVDTKPDCVYYATYWAFMNAFGFDELTVNGPHLDTENLIFNY